MNNQEEIKKELAERFNGLQKEVQDAIMSSQYEEKLYAIAQKHKLTIEQIGKLELNTTLVMLGHTHPDEYAQELQEDLVLPKEKITEIVTEVNEQVLKNIREILKGNFERENKEEQAFDAVPPPPYAEILPNISTPPVSINEASAPVLEAQAVPKMNMVPQTEGGVMSSAGIELVTDEAISPEPKINTAPTEQQVQTDRTGLAKSGINVVAEPNASYKEVQMKVSKEVQEETLSGIENPPKLSSSIIGQKLSGALINTNTSTNRTPLPTIIRAPIGTPAPDTGASGAPHGNDQYREQV